LAWTTIALVCLLGGGGVWYSYPSHREKVERKVHQLNEKYRRLEDSMMHRLMKKKHRAAARINALLHRSDSDGDGLLEDHEIDHDGIFDIVEDALSENKEGTMSKVTFFVIGLLLSCLEIIVVYAFCFGHRKAIPEDCMKGKLKLWVLSCSSLPDVEHSKKNGDVTDAVVEATIGGKRNKTEVVKNNLNPAFNTGPWDYTVDLHKETCKKLQLRIADSDNGLMGLGADKPIGTAEVNLVDFAASANETVELNAKIVLVEGVTVPQGEPTPTIMVKGVYTPNPPMVPKASGVPATKKTS